MRDYKPTPVFSNINREPATRSYNKYSSELNALKSDATSNLYVNTNTVFKQYRPNQFPNTSDPQEIELLEFCSMDILSHVLTIIQSCVKEIRFTPDNLSTHEVEIISNSTGYCVKVRGAISFEYDPKDMLDMLNNLSINTGEGILEEPPCISIEKMSLLMNVLVDFDRCISQIIAYYKECSQHTSNRIDEIRAKLNKLEKKLVGFYSNPRDIRKLNRWIDEINNKLDLFEKRLTRKQNREQCMVVLKDISDKIDKHLN